MIPNKDKVYVILQFILFGVYVIFSVRNLDLHSAMKLGGMIITILGLGLICIAFLQLNKRLSAFPTPKEKSTLVSTGVYAWFRHPIYTGIILAGLGYAFYTNDSLKLGLTLILYILFEFKAAYEEKLLTDKFDHYEDYKKKTWKIFPFTLIR